jgi:O-methyltransferase involved in polyketide biosynthesis
MATPPPLPEGSKEKIVLRGAAATLLFTLAGRLDDFRQPEPILNDKWAAHVADQLDYDYSIIGITATTRDTLCHRTVCFDRWTQEFLDAHKHEQVTVLHLACGLDTRAHRVQWGSNVR